MPAVEPAVEVVEVAWRPADPAVRWALLTALFGFEPAPVTGDPSPLPGDSAAVRTRQADRYEANSGDVT